MVTRALVILVMLTEIVVAKPRRVGRFWDHAKHESLLAAKNVKAPACTRCHPVDATKPTGELLPHKSAAQEHPMCTGSGCHTLSVTTSCGRNAAKDAVGVPTNKVCIHCHEQNERDPSCAKTPPIPPMLGARIGHGAHAGFAEAPQQCVFCHADQVGAVGGAVLVPPASKAHESCSAGGNCHATSSDKRPAMTDCVGCHMKAAAVARTKGQFELASFDHANHATKSRQTACTGCHARGRGPDPFAPLLPRMIEDCQNSCHNGQNNVFPTTGTKCTKCHTGAGTSDSFPNTQHFSHASHASRGFDVMNCTQCHSLGPKGEVTPSLSGKDHAPCADARCHQSEFASNAKPPRGTRVCGVCHDNAAPWTHLAVRPTVAKKVGAESLLERVEWFTDMNHAKHTAQSSANATCNGCHGEKLAGKPRPRDHAACAECHLAKERPRMTECAACHLPRAPGHAEPSEWSVRANFKHETHTIDPRAGGATKCVECHDTIVQSTAIQNVATPRMATCGGCHDGKQTARNGGKIFKVTGFECAKCHLKVAAR